MNAEVNRFIETGMRRARSGGRLLAYVWSTPTDWLPALIDELPDSAVVVCISEWGVPFVRGDYEGTVNEYSISVVGPGEASRRNWAQAKDRGLVGGAKMQIANSLELYALPYIPALRLVAEHLRGVLDAGVEVMMLGWTTGGSPSPNLDLVTEYLHHPASTVDEALTAVALGRYGEQAEGVVAAWNELSEAFQQFPFDISVCYVGPQSVGPANLLYPGPSGYPATMITFPYDDLVRWRGPYSEEQFLEQFELLEERWRIGVGHLRQLSLAHPRPALVDELRVAEACGLHFRSTVNQIRQIRARGINPEEALEAVRDEITVARKLRQLVRHDSRLGFEATAQYIYVGTDLLEKILNCRQLLGELTPIAEGERP